MNYGPERRRLPIRINGSNPTFRIDTPKIEKSLVSPLDDVMLDLLDVACVVFATDSAVRRGTDARRNLGGGWDRQLEFRIPVRLPELWQRDALRTALVEAVEFLTGDTASFTFFRLNDSGERQAFLEFDPRAGAFRANEVILFSGGLDSFSGALEALETRKGNVILVTHRSAQKVVPRQERLGQHLMDSYPGRILHLQIKATNKGHEGMETTQRSRSLLFAALGQVVARAFGAGRVSFYENGIISHNLPINQSVIGTMATRTTHPVSLRLIERLMAELDPNAVPIRNPFEWMTKSEVVERAVRFGGKQQIKHTVSCTSVREQGVLHTHCGTCSQCIDRRFAILSLGLGDFDPSEMYKVDVLLGERSGDKALTMAVDWTRTAVEMGRRSEVEFVVGFTKQITDIVRGYPGTPASVVFGRTYDMHRRQAETVRGVLEKQLIEHARALADHSLPATCLLRMHVSGSSIKLEPAQHCRQPRQMEVAQNDERDLVVDADRPLEVSFFKEGGRAVIAVTGLDRVEGRPAEIAHLLKVPFEADRTEGRKRSECRFTPVGTLAGNLSCTKQAITKSVERCRLQLKEAYRQVHQRLPAEPLLIENRRPSGYRLDPDIRIVKQSG